MTYPQHGPAGVPASPDLPDVERQVLAYWEADHTFEASVQARPAGDNGSNEYVFYDGPPFANGLPHYGHLLTGYVKDVVPRYQTMRGHRVERRFGWDCHGLPAEIEAERTLGITTKSEITDLGVDKFNDVCREAVLRYTNEWERYVNRQARWVDFSNDYKTLDLSYMESVMWAFKSLYDKGLVYEGVRVLPYCWRCETPLSNTETRMDDGSYRERVDPAVTVRYRLNTGEQIWSWTTMPWTLVPNLALVVGPDIDYAVLEKDGDKIILAESRLGAYAPELAGAVRVGTVKGTELVGRTYTPMFDFIIDRVRDTPAYTVLSGDFVSTEDGTGVVQVSPGHGEDDYVVCTAAGIDVVMMLDNRTRFTAMAPPFEGLQVFEANKSIIRSLRERGLVVRQEDYAHPYPYCWRCDTPLVYTALSSWFVAVTKFKDRMVELNRQIDWTPGHVKDGSFGRWLANARDWTISRNRFWGSPIPVWRSDNPDYPRIDVYGSLAELERDFGVTVTDLHRPLVDELVRPNPDDPTGRSMMRRVPEVLDCWFESGSMPFAQVHYPFENRDWFEHHYPGDFIVEYIGQVRGWFYTLHVLATALFDRPAFRSCVVHGILLGQDGRKMSKSLRNYPDVYEMFDKYGSDSLRWFLLSSPILRGGDMPVTETGIREAARQVLLPLWNVWYFFSLYANIEKYDGGGRTDSAHVLDRYVLAKTHELASSMTAAMDRYDVAAASQAVHSYLDALTNWYVRRSRDRFWSGDTDAFATLYTALETLCRLLAPIAPMTTEEVWRGLTGGRSVHLADWPDAALVPADPDLAQDMDEVREVCSVALSLRKARGLRVRLPLSRVTVATPDAERLARFADLIADEINVKLVEFTTDVDTYCRQVLSVVPRVLGPRLGAQVQQVIQAVKAGDWSIDGGTVTAGGVVLREGEYELRPVAVDTETSAPLRGGEGVVVLHTDLTPQLVAEGMARDVIRVVQLARRAAGMAVSDRVRLTIDAPEDVAATVRKHRATVAAEVLAESVTFRKVANGFAGEVGDGQPVLVRVTKV
jgi:isoleucyl-tRNA synthetase